MSRIVALVLTCVSLATADRFASAAPMTVEEFVGQEDNWLRFAQAGIPLEIVGRYSAASPSALRLTKCRMPFRPARGSKFARIRRTESNVQVTGFLESRGRRLTFIVQQMQELPGDLRRLRTRQQELPGTMPDGWYQLADETIARSRFYDDEELLAEARKLYERGVKIEYSRLAGDDAVGRRKLAEKVARYELDDSLRQQWLHESLRQEWIKLRKDGKADLKPFLSRLVSDLPGCEIPPERNAKTLDADYVRNSLGVYRDADPRTRKVLHRLFYGDVVLTDITRNADPDGSDGFRIATAIEAALPERSDLAEQHRLRALESQLTRVASLPRSGIEQLEEQLRQRGLTDKADQARSTWINHEVQRLWQLGTRGRLAAAELTLEFEGDRESAIEIARRAWREAGDPGSKRDIETWLAEYGVYRAEARWMSEKTANHQGGGMNAMIRLGKVIKGMSSDQVRQALSGGPTRTTRLASADRIDLIWIFDEPGASRLGVRFTRSSNASNSRFRVVSVSSFGR